MRRFLGFAVITITTVAIVIAGFADAPHTPPGYALHSSAIWRLEVFVAALVAIHIPLSLIAGAFHGRMLTALHAGPASADTGLITKPDREQTAGIQEASGAMKELRRTIEDGFKDLGSRVSTLERQAGIDADIAHEER
ncbi:MAG TPA: hypothetical protein VF526_05645 [Solirubrobacteraceae bacterium]|jgi:hypothetical protein